MAVWEVSTPLHPGPPEFARGRIRWGDRGAVFQLSILDNSPLERGLGI